MAGTTKYYDCFESKDVEDVSFLERIFEISVQKFRIIYYINTLPIIILFTSLSITIRLGHKDGEQMLCCRKGSFSPRSTIKSALWARLIVMKMISLNVTEKNLPKEAG